MSAARPRSVAPAAANWRTDGRASICWPASNPAMPISRRASADSDAENRVVSPIFWAVSVSRASSSLVAPDTAPAARMVSSNWANFEVICCNAAPAPNAASPLRMLSTAPDTRSAVFCIRPRLESTLRTTPETPSFRLMRRPMVVFWAIYFNSKCSICRFSLSSHKTESHRRIDSSGVSTHPTP